jgi:hypothetical protein
MPCRTVVGIVQDVHQLKLQPESRMYSYYLPAPQFDARGSLVIRMTSDARHQLESIRRALQREMPGASYVRVTALSDFFGARTRSWRLSAAVVLLTVSATASLIPVRRAANADPLAALRSE